MRRAIAIAAAAGAALAAGCKSDGPKPDHGGGSNTPGTGPSLAMTAAVNVPLADGASWPPRARIVILTATGMRLLPDGAAPAVDAGGNLELPDGETVTRDGLAALPPEASVVIVADAEAKADILPPMIAALGLRCWGLGVGSGGRLAALAPKPCPPTAPTDPALVQLAIWVRRDGTMVGLSRVDELTEVGALASLEPHLREQKRTAFFADRTDLAITVDDDITVGELATALGAALRSGFTNARWIPVSALPVRFADGTGTTRAGGDAIPDDGNGLLRAVPQFNAERDRVVRGGSGRTPEAQRGAWFTPRNERASAVRPEAPEIRGRSRRSIAGQLLGTGGTGAGVAGPKVKLGELDGSFAGLTADEINRVVRARAGIMRACYQRELARDAGLAGDVVLTIDISADGTVASVAATGGSLAKGTVGTCVATQARRMRFPAKGGAKVSVPITFAAR